VSDTYSTFTISETMANQIRELPEELQLKYFWAITELGIFNVDTGFKGLELALWLPMRDLILRTKRILPLYGKLKDERNTGDYKHWIKSVFKRDKYTCQHCGRIGGKLNAHHIKPFAKYPELRLDVNNGITYCRQCHIDWHKKHGRCN
jgi:hypothetical protein